MPSSCRFDLLLPVPVFLESEVQFFLEFNFYVFTM
jgi:hypothetical protein